LEFLLGLLEKVADMKRNTRCFLLRFLVSLAVGFVFSASGIAGQVSLDDISSQLGKEIAQANLRSVAVADFLTPDGKPSDLGWYLAAKLSDSWLQRHQEFLILDRAELPDTKVSANDLRSSEALKRIGEAWGVTAIVTGTVDISADHYLLTASVLRVADGAAIATASQPVAHSRILDLLSPQGLGEDGAAPLRGGVNGTGVPACIFCPAPSYSGKASKARLQSSVLLAVTVSKDGRTARISILKDPGYGLTETAIEAVSGWNFKPAISKEGKPVPVVVPVEVTFRMTRS
jgi:TonB family protein